MFCMNCGKALPDGAKFCMYCGTPLGAAAAPAQAVSAGSPTPCTAGRLGLDWSYGNGTFSGTAGQGRFLRRQPFSTAHLAVSGTET